MCCLLNEIEYMIMCMLLYSVGMPCAHTWVVHVHVNPFVDKNVFLKYCTHATICLSSIMW